MEVGFSLAAKIIRMGAWRGEDTRGQVVNFLNQFRSRLSIVRVDAIGIGHNFGLHLRDCRFPVEMVNVGMPCESKPQRRENCQLSSETPPFVSFETPPSVNRCPVGGVRGGIPLATPREKPRLSLGSLAFRVWA